MSQRKDIASRHDEIRLLFADNKVSDALKKVMDFARDLAANDDLIDEAIILLQNYRELKNELRRKEIMREAAKEEKNQLIFQALRLTRVIVECADDMEALLC